MAMHRMMMDWTCVHLHPPILVLSTIASVSVCVAAQPGLPVCFLALSTAEATPSCSKQSLSTTTVCLLLHPHPNFGSICLSRGFSLCVNKSCECNVCMRMPCSTNKLFEHHCTVCALSGSSRPHKPRCTWGRFQPINDKSGSPQATKPPAWCARKLDTCTHTPVCMLRVLQGEQ